MTQEIVASFMQRDYSDLLMHFFSLRLSKVVGIKLRSQSNIILLAEHSALHDNGYCAMLVVTRVRFYLHFQSLGFERGLYLARSCFTLYVQSFAISLG